MAEMEEERRKILGKLMLEEFYPDDLLVARGLNFKFEIMEFGGQIFITLEIADQNLKPYIPALIFSVRDFHKFAQEIDNVDRAAGGYFQEGITEIKTEESADDLGEPT